MHRVKLRMKFLMWQEELARRHPTTFVIFMIIYSSVLWLFLGLLLVQKYSWIRIFLISMSAGIATTVLSWRTLKRKNKWGSGRKT